MALLVEYGARVPVDSLQRPYVWTRAVKYFEGNSVATLETAINNFIATLASTQTYAAVLGVDYIGTSGTLSRVLVSYGFFTPQP